MFNKDSGESAYSWYGPVKVIIQNTEININRAGYYELHDVETGTQIIIAHGLFYKTFRDTIQVFPTEFKYDIYLEFE